MNHDAKIRILMHTDKPGYYRWFRIFFACVLLITTGYTAVHGQEMPREVRGLVMDSVTGERLPLVNIYVEGSDGGCLSSEDGTFRFRSQHPINRLIISSMGYKRRAVDIHPDSALSLRILLTPASVTLVEVTVDPRRRKYSKKNNPAVELMEKIRKSYPLHDPRDSDYYSYDIYEKMVVGLSDFHVPDSGSWSARKMPFIRDYIDTVPYADGPVLKISVKEKTSTRLFSNGDHKGKEIVTGQFTAGIDKSFNQANIQAALEDTFREISIFGNDITILQNRFVSPLSVIGANYYKYFLDTVSDGGKRLLELSFVPHNPESMGFNGKIWVEQGDSTYFVRRIKMRVPKAVNLNFVKNLYIDQTFRRDDIGNRHPVSDDITVEFQLLPGTQGVYARRQTYYTNHSHIPHTRLSKFYNETGNRFILDEAEERDEMFWSQRRMTEMPQSEREMGSLILKLRKLPVFYWGEKILSILVNGYIKTGNRSKFDFGPVNTLVSTNKAEGVRFRIGGMTTANLCPWLFGRGYVAYGLRDRKLKYQAEVDWSFVRKKYHSREFPMHLLRAEYQYDTDRIGEHYLFTNPDNIFLSIKRKGSFLITYRTLARLTYIREFPFNLSLQAGFRFERQESTKWVPFERNDGSLARKYSQSVFFLTIRYAPGEKFVQSASNRAPLNLDAPVFQITHEFGPRGLLGAAFTLNKTEFSFQKRFWFSSFGYLDAVVKYGKLWNPVYYPALLWQNANLSYTIQPESYALLNPMEFAMDQYGSVDLSYFGNGILFNRLPGIKKLKLREVLTFRGFMGHLSSHNNPTLNKSLYRFPSDANVGLMSATPYMEASAGIDNIASVLRVDYVWRLTYRNRPYIDRSGLRVSLHFSF